MVGRWQRWGDDGSYSDRIKSSWGGEAVAKIIAEKQEALRGASWVQDWRDYIDAHEETARQHPWSSDETARRYASKAWTVHKFIPANGTSWVYGSPGSLKSFFALDMACHVATGREWAGRRVRQGPVLYISAEGGDDIHLRRVAWERDHGIKAGMLNIVSIQPQLDELKGAGFNLVRNHIQAIEDVTGSPPSLIVIDTFAQTASDDTREGVSRYTRNLVELRESFAPDAAIMVIDHTTKEGRTWMGSGAKHGNTDMMCLAEKKGDTMTLSMSGGKGKIKGAAECEDIKLTARVTGSGIYDDEGEELTTLVLDHSRVTLTDRQATMLALIDGGTTRGDLRPLWGDQDFNAGAKPGAVRASFNRALDALEGFDLITVEGTEDDSMIAPV
nr:AAA family ATPase [Pontibaca salina]